MTTVPAPEEEPLSDEERLQALRDDVRIGLDQIRRGEVVSGAEVFAKLRSSLAPRSSTPESPVDSD